MLLGLVVFHFYGLFQGMAYVPVTFLLLPLATGYALTLDTAAPAPDAVPARVAVSVLVCLLGRRGMGVFERPRLSRA